MDDRAVHRADLQWQIVNAPQLYGAAGVQFVNDAKTSSPASTPTSTRRGSTRRCCPSSTPRSARRRAVEAHRRDRGGVADRRHLRQGRRQRGELGAHARGPREALRQARRRSALEGLPRAQRPRGRRSRSPSALPVRDAARVLSEGPGDAGPRARSLPGDARAKRRRPRGGRSHRHALARRSPRRLARRRALRRRAAGPGARLQLGARQQPATRPTATRSP